MPSHYMVILHPIVDYCYGVTCGGHGLCLNDYARRDYYCQCDDGWIGTDCDLQRCDHHLTCAHGSRCQCVSMQS